MTLIFVIELSIHQDPPSQTDTMAISTVNYLITILEYPNLTKIIVVPTYDTLHLLHHEIKSDVIAVHINIGGIQHGNLGLLVIPNAITLLSNAPFVRPMHPGTLIIPVVVTRHA